MKTVCSFQQKFSSLISWTLSCFDRVIFKGHLPISRAFELENFVDYVLKMRRADFMETTAREWSERLVDHAKAMAQEQGREYLYHPGEIDKDAWAKQQLHEKPVSEGLVGILCVQETCSTFKLALGEDRPGYRSQRIPQRVLYYYFVDKDLGLIHVRLQTWAPFTCQVYANGHDYLMQQLTQRGIGFEKIDNAFVHLEDPHQA